MINSAKMSGWKQLGPMALIVCEILLLLIIVILARFGMLKSSPSPAGSWNAGAVEATCAGIRVRELDPSHASVAFLYDLDNKTDADYDLVKGPDVLIMDRMESDASLRADDRANLEASAFIPARNRTRIALDITHPFAWPTKRDPAADQAFNQLVAGDLNNLRGFVLFDQNVRYQVELPAATPSGSKASAEQ